MDLSSMHKKIAENEINVYLTAAKKSAPYIGDNGNWFAWNVEEGKHIDTGVRAEAVSGVYVGSDTPPAGTNVWIDPNGDASEVIGGVVMSVKDFGAVGDGVTDDTEALRAAARCGEMVFFPKGTYIITDSINAESNINWVGEGEDSIIELRIGSNKDGTIISVNNFSISIQGLALNANHSSASMGYMADCILTSNIKSVLLNNVKFIDANMGLSLSGDTNSSVSISNCKVENCNIGINIHGINGARISNCELVYGNGECIGIYQSQNTMITNVLCANGNSGIAIYESEGTTISGLVTKSNTCGILFAECDKTLISGWNCINDTYAYYLCYGSFTSKEITGTILGLLSYTTSEYSVSSGTDASLFKVNFIGR